MIHPILAEGCHELRKPCIKVTEFDDSLFELVDDMFETMYSAKGIGLAANQIGRTERVFVFDTDGYPGYCINPVLEILGKDKIRDPEGCLSLPGYTGRVTRYERCQVMGKTKAGQDTLQIAEGLKATCFQHECDHLDGKLYYDRMPYKDRTVLKFTALRQPWAGKAINYDKVES